MTFGGHFTRIPRAGRNDPCPCGSGKKYKKCCLDKDVEAGRKARAVLPEVMEKFAEQAVRHERTNRILRERYGIFIDLVPPAHFQGRRVRALGSRLYADRPPNETFAEFIVSRVLKPAAIAAGLGDWVAFHTFRHTRATILFRSGWNAVQVQKFLGHSDPGFTMRRYIHLLDDDLPEPQSLGGGTGVVQREAETGRDQVADAADWDGFA